MDSAVRTTILPYLDGLELKEARFCSRSFPPHFHDRLSIGYVERGVEALSIRGAEQIVSPGTVAVLNPGDVHAHRGLGRMPWLYRVVYASPDLVTHRWRALGRSGPPPPIANAILGDAQLLGDLRSFHARRGDGTEGLWRILDRLLSRHAVSEAPAGPSSDADAIRDAAQFIIEHLAETHRTDQIAARFSMPGRRFARSFRRQLGVTPAAFQMIHRINRAASLLIEGHRVVEVGLEVGFYDQSHFVRHFKSFLGVPPSAFRDSCQRD